MIVWLCSIPRSGNTFLRMVLHNCTAERVPTYSMYKDVALGKYVQRLIDHRYLDVKHLRIADESPNVYFVKTHSDVLSLPYRAQCIYLVRDPRDVAVSMAHYKAWRNPGLGVFKKTIELVIKESRWHRHVKASYDQADCIVKYEELIAHPLAELRRIVAELELSLTVIDSELPSFQALHEEHPHFFRKGLARSYHTELTKDHERRLCAPMTEVMKKVGYV